MNPETAEMLHNSYFATLVDVARFLAWASEPNQIFSEWDITRYQQAIELRNVADKHREWSILEIRHGQKTEENE